jgi:hypothetical protein
MPPQAVVGMHGGQEAVVVDGVVVVIAGGVAIRP